MVTRLHLSSGRMTDLGIQARTLAESQIIEGECVVLKDDDGDVRARLEMVGSAPRVTFYESAGTPRVSIGFAMDDGGDGEELGAHGRGAQCAARRRGALKAALPRPLVVGARLPLRPGCMGVRRQGTGGPGVPIPCARARRRRGTLGGQGGLALRRPQGTAVASTEV